MAGDRPEDELARTATAPGSASASATPAAPLGDTLGRYRLERMLGEGGMGVVHAAFDPDLERRVALKVLRAADGGGEARQRLLREARAMARLTHPNVVTVHEVGSATGRDYVAMELVDGQTLADWLRSQPRAPDEILTAFLAAGRGLAAAHAAGLVHRDFKPHNVLRQHDGRVVVTDFGLARGVESTPAVAFEATMRLGKGSGGAATAAKTPSSLSGLTVTGSLLGTPAYMAPEQWCGGTVGPPADQFAFCVALWEALTGERPFKGDTLDALKAEVQRGPAALDASKLPRALRAPLLRGLDPDPAKRWPSMDALLAALRPKRRPRLALTAVASAVIAAAAIFVAIGHGGGGPSCPVPAMDPARVWSPARAAALGDPVSADQLTGVLHRWREVRGSTCSGDRVTRAARLQCLDGVLAWTDVAARAAEATHDVHGEAGAWLVDPEVCQGPRIPRLIHTASPALREAVATWLRNAASPAPYEPGAAAKLVAHAASDPCASALAHVLAAGAEDTAPDERRRDFDDADSAAQICGDDRIIAEVAIAAADDAIEDRGLGAEITTKVRRAQALAKTVAQPDVTALVELLLARISLQADQLDEAIARADAASGHDAARGRIRAEIAADLMGLGIRKIRGRPEDLAAVPQRLADWRALAVKRLGEADDAVRRIDLEAASWLFATGDDAAAHARLDALRRAVPDPQAQRITGRVVDASGAPVAGALVAADERLNADSISIAFAYDGGGGLRTATTRGDGTFVIPDAPSHGVIAAQLGDLRSPAVSIADGVSLALAPTSAIEGQVALHGVPPTKVTVVARAHDQPMVLPYAVIAPVRPDGTFTIRGVPRGPVVLRTVVNTGSQGRVTGIDLDLRDPIVHGVDLAVAASKRVVQVIVRSTVGMPLPNAQVLVFPGEMPAVTNARAVNTTMHDATETIARQLEGEHAPAGVLARAKPGDLYATMTQIPEGPASACAIALPADLADPDLARKIMPHLDKIEVRCVPIGPTDDVVVVEVPPWPRFD